MKGTFANLAATARLASALAAMLALLLLATWPAGSGVGLVAGATAAMGLLMHLLMFGVRASRRAAPLWVLQALVLVGVGAATAGGLPGLRHVSNVLLEAGLFAIVVGGSGWAFVAIAARAPTLGEERAW